MKNTKSLNSLLDDMCKTEAEALAAKQAAAEGPAERDTYTREEVDALIAQKMSEYAESVAENEKENENNGKENGSSENE